MAAPVGKWALQQGFRAAVGIVTHGLKAGQKKQDAARKPGDKGSAVRE